MMTKRMIGLLLLGLVLGWVGWAGAADTAEPQYQTVAQADLAGSPEAFEGKKVQIQGDFLFTGSDFCYQIRKTKINTRDYFCFALGAPSLVRLYLKKDHPQADELLGLKKGQKVLASGTFDFVGGNYNFMVVDKFTVQPAG